MDKSSDKKPKASPKKPKSIGVSKKSTTAKKPVRKSTTPRTSKTKIKKFAAEYVASSGNKRRAAKAAGSKAKNLSEAGREFLNNPEVQQAVVEVTKEAEKALPGRIMSAREVLERMSVLASADMKNLVDDQGIFDFQEAKKRGVTACVKEFRTHYHPLTGNFIGHTARFYDSLKALTQMGRFHGLEQAPAPNERGLALDGVKKFMEATGVIWAVAVVEMAKANALVAKFEAEFLESPPLQIANGSHQVS